MATQHANAALTSQEQEEQEEQHVLIFQQLENYAWDSDPEFQTGLQALLGSDPSAEQAEHLILRARCFYFARKANLPIDFSAYQTWRSQSSSSRPNGMSVLAPASAPSSVSRSPPNLDSTSRNGRDTASRGDEATAPYPKSFSEIVQLITSGDPILGIKDVPDTVLQGQASRPIKSKRRKPWENNDAGAGEEIVGATNFVTQHCTE